MSIISPPSPSRNILAISTLFFTLPVLLFQGAIVLLAAWNGMTPTLLWLWLVGTAVGFALSGGAYVWRITTHVDPSSYVYWGREGGFLIGFVNVFLGGLVIVGYFIWYANWWLPSLSTQEAASFGFGVFLPTEVFYLIVANLGFMLLSVLGGALAAYLRGRLER